MPLASSSSISRASSTLTPQQQVLAECLALIGRPLRRTTVVAFPLAIVLAFALRNHVQITMLGLWLGLVAGATIILTYVAGFEPPLDTAESIENRRNEVVSTVGLLGAAWGSSTLLVYPTEVTLRLLLGACLLAMMSSVGLGTLLLRPAFFVLAIPAYAPLFFKLATSSEPDQFAMAAVLSVCLVSLILHFLESNASSVTLIRNRVENALLGVRVERLKGRIVATEEELEVAYRTIDEHQRGLGVPLPPVERAAVLSRTAFNARLGDTWAATNADTESFSVALVEIADYVGISSEYGDEVTKRLFEELGRFIGSCLRTEDCVSGFAAPRYGLLLCESDTETASRALERIRRRVESTPIDAGQPILCRLTMGVVSFESGIRPMEMIGRAERALAQAWNADNRLRSWERLDGSPLSHVNTPGTLILGHGGMNAANPAFRISGTVPREMPKEPPRH